MAEGTHLEGDRLKHVIAPLLGSAKSECCMTAVRREIDRLSVRWRVVEVVRIVRTCQEKCRSNPQQEMRLLIPFGFWLCNNNASASASVVERLSALISDERKVLSASVFALQAIFYCSNKRFSLAAAALDKGFAWLERHKISHEMLMVSTSVLVANRVGRHDLALRYAFKCYEAAFNSESAVELEIANFAVINSNRLSTRGCVSITHDFNRPLDIIEKGKSRIVLINQQLLPVYAAFAELSAGCPDGRRVQWLFGLAEDLEIHGSSDYGQRAYHLAVAKLHVLQGAASAAKEALFLSRRHAGTYDFNLDLEERQLCSELRIAFPDQRDVPSLEEGDWKGLEARLEGWGI